MSMLNPEANAMKLDQVDWPAVLPKFFAIARRKLARWRPHATLEVGDAVNTVVAKLYSGDIIWPDGYALEEVFPRMLDSVIWHAHIRQEGGKPVLRDRPGAEADVADRAEAGPWAQLPLTPDVLFGASSRWDADYKLRWLEVECRRRADGPELVALLNALRMGLASTRRALARLLGVAPEEFDSRRDKLLTLLARLPAEVPNSIRDDPWSDARLLAWLDAALRERPDAEALGLALYAVCARLAGEIDMLAARLDWAPEAFEAQLRRLIHLAYWRPEQAPEHLDDAIWDMRMALRWILDARSPPRVSPTAQSLAACAVDGEALTRSRLRERVNLTEQDFDLATRELMRAAVARPIWPPDWLGSGGPSGTTHESDEQ